MQGDYVLSKAARGLEEIAKARESASAAKRKRQRAAHAQAVSGRKATVASRSAERVNLDRVMASPEGLKLDTNPPKKTKVPVANPVTHTAPAAAQGRLAATGAKAAQFAVRHPYSLGAAAAAALAGGGGGLYAMNRRG